LGGVGWWGGGGRGPPPPPPPPPTPNPQSPIPKKCLLELKKFLKYYINH